jgi:glycosyltransferase involved in cell wall biosynthesis
MGAYAADPVDGESFVLLMRADRPDPTDRWKTLRIVGRRVLPPPRLTAAATPAGDPVVLGGVSLGAGWRSTRSGSAGTVYHAAGAAIPFGMNVPRAGRLPLVATMLDLAPWQLPDVYQRTVGARFGARLRRRILHGSVRLIVGTEAVRRAARRLLRVPEERIVVVPFAPRSAFVDARPDSPAIRAEAVRHGLGARYLVYAGRFDARHDLPTLLAALAAVGSAGRPSPVPADEPWPPRIAIVGASPADRAAIARAAMRVGVGEWLAFVPAVADDRLAAIVSGARAVLVPVLADAVGLSAIEGLALGVPVIASGVDGLPEIVGDAGLIVPPRQPARLAAAMTSLVEDDRLRDALASRARDRGRSNGARTWLDVARETRAVYGAVLSPPRT